jgi:hypothetical protein
MSLVESGIKCYNCSQSLGLNPGENIGRQEECPQCYASLHCCKMCTFYDTSAYNDCKEPMANRVLEKEKANFCDFFKLSAPSSGGDDKNSLLDAANSLFKD